MLLAHGDRSLPSRAILNDALVKADNNMIARLQIKLFPELFAKRAILHCKIIGAVTDSERHTFREHKFSQYSAGRLGCAI